MTVTQVESDGATIAVTDLGGDGPTVVLLHGLAGSSRELMPTAEALSDSFRVLLIDQRGHGASTRRPASASRESYVDDVVRVVRRFADGERVVLVGQSMGAHTAFLTAAAHPGIVRAVVMLEGHAGGSESKADAEGLGAFFRSWPTPFADEQAARAFLGESVLTDAWIVDMERADGGFVPRFDADFMQHTLAAVHEPRWSEWRSLEASILAVFAESGMFSEQQKAELLATNPRAQRVDIAGASHDAHLDAFEQWISVLRD
ncbi:alpha/beta fold hydrolase [Microbacterium sp.]|uniref:alpha/beta fold hydrolase n=1 Tax=Microbacterium sp. TaxID=51671 RepID=UPI0039E54050